MCESAAVFRSVAYTVKRVPVSPPKKSCKIRASDIPSSPVAQVADQARTGSPVRLNSGSRISFIIVKCRDSLKKYVSLIVTAFRNRSRSEGSARRMLMYCGTVALIALVRFVTASVSVR